MPQISVNTVRDDLSMKRRPDAARGIVKFWKPDKGWGAISSPALPDGKDAWAHFGVIEMSGYKELVAGQEVEFRYTPARQDSFDFVAEWVRPL